jgi:hypothetical protein
LNVILRPPPPYTPPHPSQPHVPQSPLPPQTMWGGGVGYSIGESGGIRILFDIYIYIYTQALCEEVERPEGFSFVSE